MIILAIETSCDDTCIAIVNISKKNYKVLSSIVSSQIEIHKKWGGVYPALAKREHEKNLPLVLEKALKKAKYPNIDALAVTIGPGLEPCLWVGLNFAKALSFSWDLPLIPVNHIEGHLLVNNPKKFPAIALIVSGGHTQLILIKGIGKYKILGETRDDAAGECFDKVARILGLGYPGGEVIYKKAKQFKGKTKLSLPRPMMNQNNYDFSFSGLKTAVLYNKNNNIVEVCKEVQQAIIDVLVKKTIKAMRDYKIDTLILGGGVSANKELRKQFKKQVKNLLVPDPKYSTDNAVMIALTAYHKKPKEISKPDANLRIC
jgi:N6-L-threonylcarbamoyladenine synthase